MPSPRIAEYRSYAKTRLRRNPVNSRTKPRFMSAVIPFAEVGKDKPVSPRHFIQRDHGSFVANHCGYPEVVAAAPLPESLYLVRVLFE